MSAPIKPSIIGTSDLEPLIPSGTDLRHVAVFEVNISNLFHSEFIQLATNEELGAAAKLWLRSLFQVPAGSLPNDEIILAKLAGYDHRAKSWQRVRGMALYGWVLCSDGRLYHHEIAQMVFDFLLEQDIREWPDADREAIRALRAGHLTGSKDKTVTGKKAGGNRYVH